MGWLQSRKFSGKMLRIRETGLERNKMENKPTILNFTVKTEYINKKVFEIYQPM